MSMKTNIVKQKKVEKKSSKEDLKKSEKGTEDVQEATTTGSVGGSFETPAGFVNKRDMKQLEDLKEQTMNIKLNELFSIVKKTLIKEEVYSQKPSESTGTNLMSTEEKKGKEISTKNAKVAKKYDSAAGKATTANTKKTGTQANTEAKKSAKKAENFSKNNLDGAEVEDVNKTKLQNDDQRIEAGANGLQDTEYDAISPEKQKQNKDYIKNESAMDSPNSQDTGVNDQFIDDAQKRHEQSHDDYINKNYDIFGSDVTAKPNQNANDHHKKQLAYENTMKKLTFKKPIKNEKDLMERVNKLPNKFKINEGLFEVADKENRYKLRWEGHATNGIAVILEHRNLVVEAAAYEKHMKLSEYNTKESNVSSSTINEHDMFKQMLGESRDLSNNVERTLESAFTPPSKKKKINEAYNFIGSIGNKQANNRQDIAAIQVALNAVNNAGLKVDGLFGRKTWSAIQPLMKNFGGDRTGRFEGIPLKELMTGYFNQGINGSVGKNGQNDKMDVAKIQVLLNSLNQNINVKLKIDGLFGGKTLAAIQAFNRDIGNTKDPLIINPKSYQYNAMVKTALGGHVSPSMGGEYDSNL